MLAVGGAAHHLTSQLANNTMNHHHWRNHRQLLGVWLCAMGWGVFRMFSLTPIHIIPRITLRRSFGWVKCGFS